MNKIEFLKEWFYKEDERKNALNDSITFEVNVN